MGLTLDEVVRPIPLSNWSHADKIRLFAWYLHSHRGLKRFAPADIGRCYDELNLEKPSGIAPYLAGMGSRSPKQVLRDSKGYYLEKMLRDALQQRYGRRSISIEISDLLTSLPEHVPDVAERDFLDEALTCYRNHAFRAAIVMCWNLAFDHLLNFVLKHHLPKFNTQWPRSYPKQHSKARVPSISCRDDFSELKESEIIQICRSGGIISNDVYKILNLQLGKRNTAAHPSAVIISQLQAESFIDDLVRNVVMKLRI